MRIQATPRTACSVFMWLTQSESPWSWYTSDSLLATSPTAFIKLPYVSWSSHDLTSRLSQYCSLMGTGFLWHSLAESYSSFKHGLRFHLLQEAFWNALWCMHVHTHTHTDTRTHTQIHRRRLGNPRLDSSVPYTSCWTTSKAFWCPLSPPNTKQHGDLCRGCPVHRFLPAGPTIPAQSWHSEYTWGCAPLSRNGDPRPCELSSQYQAL